MVSTMSAVPSSRYPGTGPRRRSSTRPAAVKMSARMMLTGSGSSRRGRRGRAGPRRPRARMSAGRSTPQYAPAARSARGGVGGGGGNRTRVHGRLGGVSTGLAGAFDLARGPRVGRVPLASPDQSRVRSLGAARPHPSPLDDTADPGRGRAGCDAPPNYLGGECEGVILGK